MKEEELGKGGSHHLVVNLLKKNAEVRVSQRSDETFSSLKFRFSEIHELKSL